MLCPPAFERGNLQVTSSDLQTYHKYTCIFYQGVPLGTVCFYERIYRYTHLLRMSCFATSRDLYFAVPFARSKLNLAQMLPSHFGTVVKITNSSAYLFQVRSSFLGCHLCHHVRMIYEYRNVSLLHFLIQVFLFPLMLICGSRNIYS